MSDHLDEARNRRAGLNTTMGELEAALASPAGGREKAWRIGVRSALERLSEAITLHIEITEAPGAVLDDIASREPGLKQEVDKTRAEHERLRYLLEVAVAAVDDTKVEPADVRERAVELLVTVVRHRQLGAELIYQAYNVHLDVVD